MKPCSATAISPQTFITAAHCVKDETRIVYLSNSLDFVREHNRAGVFGQRRALMISRDQIHIPKEYFSADPEIRARNDVALIRLSRGVPWPVTPAKIGRSASGAYIIVGYGMNESGGGEGRPRWVSKEVEDVDPAFIWLEQADRRGVCMGDSGGPGLFWREGERYPTLISIHYAVVFSKGLDPCSHLGQSLKVWPHREWIKSIAPDVEFIDVLAFTNQPGGTGGRPELKGNTLVHFDDADGDLGISIPERH